ncbi:Pituitary adenylate cyclase-activating polypeptide type I receptor, partial [Fragariocoptes setiger]
ITEGKTNQGIIEFILKLAGETEDDNLLYAIHAILKFTLDKDYTPVDAKTQLSMVKAFNGLVDKDELDPMDLIADLIKQSTEETISEIYKSGLALQLVSFLGRHGSMDEDKIRSMGLQLMRKGDLEFKVGDPGFADKAYKCIDEARRIDLQLLFDGEPTCPQVWDGVSCWPPTRGNVVAVQPCMTELNGLQYEPGNVLRFCYSNGVWGDRSDYSQCRIRTTHTAHSELRHHNSNHNASDTSVNVTKATKASPMTNSTLGFGHSSNVTQFDTQSMLHNISGGHTNSDSNSDNNAAPFNVIVNDNSSSSNVTLLTKPHSNTTTGWINHNQTGAGSQLLERTQIGLGLLGLSGVNNVNHQATAPSAAANNVTFAFNAVGVGLMSSLASYNSNANSSYETPLSSNYTSMSGGAGGGGGVGASYATDLGILDFELMMTAEISTYGYWASLVSTMVALILFSSFKQLCCVRNTIHKNFNLSYALLSACWLFTVHLQTSHRSLPFSWHIGCAGVVAISYLMVTNFTWMFVEGIYLYSVITDTFNADNVNFHYYRFIGWGLPALTIAVWAVVKKIYMDKMDEVFKKTLRATILLMPLLGLTHVVLYMPTIQALSRFMVYAQVIALAFELWNRRRKDRNHNKQRGVKGPGCGGQDASRRVYPGSANTTPNTLTTFTLMLPIDEANGGPNGNFNNDNINNGHHNNHNKVGRRSSTHEFRLGSGPSAVTSSTTSTTITNTTHCPAATTTSSTKPGRHHSFYANRNHSNVPSSARNNTTRYVVRLESLASTHM